MSHDLTPSVVAARRAEAGVPADEIEITPAMIQAGCQVLKDRYLSLNDVDEFPAIVRIVYEAMQGSRLRSARKDR
jgi:hypothetical protein